MKTLIALAILLVCGCTVNTSHLWYAEKACRNNGGLSHIETAVPFSGITVYCVNGATFTTADFERWDASTP